MAKTVIDLSNFKDRVGGRVAPGRYRVQVEDVEEVKTRNGDKMFNLFLRVVGGEFDGQTIVDRLVQTENALFRTVNFLQALGHPTPRKRLSVDTAAWVGKMVEVDVEDGEPYRGTIRSEVRGYNKIAKSSQPTEDIEDVEDSADEAEETASEETEAPAKAEKQDAPAAEPEAEDVDLDEVDL